MHPLSHVSVLALVIASGLAVSSCAELLDIPKDPELSGPFSCLERADGSAASTTAAKARVQVQACNFVSTSCGDPVTGLTAKLCSKRDVHCTQPILSGIRDDNGLISFEVDTGPARGPGFDGYLSISSTAAPCDDEKVFGPEASALCNLAPGCVTEGGTGECKVPLFAPAMLFFNPPIRASTSAPMPLPLLPTAAAKSITEAAKGTFDPNYGNVFVTVLDCNGQPAPGVRLEMTQNRTNPSVVYIDNGVVSGSASATDRSGLGGFMNVPAGFANIEGVVGVTTDDELEGQRVGNVGVQVAPFTITYATLFPSR